ncbi:peroxisomal biogenesis factor 19-like, partial [Lagopus leucura]
GSAASEEDLAKAMEGLGLEEGSGEGGVLPVVQSVLQHLLSRDVLYPSLKEITDKYPEWLQRHRAALPEEQYERYRAQHGVMSRICQQLEAERPEDSEGDRRARFEAVLELMQQLQELGHPPKELAGEAVSVPQCPQLSLEVFSMLSPTVPGSRPSLVVPSSPYLSLQVFPTVPTCPPALSHPSCSLPPPSCPQPMSSQLSFNQPFPVVPSCPQRFPTVSNCPLQSLT